MRCSHCGSDVNGPLPDGDESPAFVVKLDGVIYCAYCFRTAHPRLWLYFGGDDMLGLYGIDTAVFGDV